MVRMVDDEASEHESAGGFRFDSLAWGDIEQSLDTNGCAVRPPLVSASQCGLMAALRAIIFHDARRSAPLDPIRLARWFLGPH